MLTLRPARRLAPTHAVAAGPSRPAHRSGGTDAVDSAGRSRRPQPLLLALLLLGVLVVGVPILVLARVPAAHADAWDGASEHAASDPAGSDLTGAQATGTPGPAPWDAEATAALQQLRNGLEALEPARSADDTPRTTAFGDVQPTAPDRRDRGGVPLTTPTLGYLLTRDPETQDAVLPAAEGDGGGNGDPRPPDSPGPTDQAPAPTWTVTLRLELVDRTALHPTDPDPTAAQPGHPDPTPTASQPNHAPDTLARDHPRQPPAVATGWQPDQDSEAASLVIADGDPHSPASNAWLHVATSDLPAGTGPRIHPGGQLPDLPGVPVASSSAVGQPPATAPFVQLPAQPRPVLGSPPPATPNASPKVQPAHTLSTGRFEPVHDGFLPSLPQATIVLTAAPTPAGSLATGSQVPLAAGTPLVAPLPAGAALLAANVPTSRILQAGIASWDGQGWEYLAAAGLFIGGLALAISPIAAAGAAALGAAMLTTALWAASASVTFQKYTTGKVDWRSVAAWSALSAVAGGLFYGLDFLLAGTAIWRWFILGGVAGKAEHLAGETRWSRLPGWWWWPRYRIEVRNYAQPGTVDWWDTAVHEGFHALVDRYAGPVTWLANLKLGPIPVGAPVKYAEEVVAQAVGHAAVGRLHGVVVAPLTAFQALTLGESVTTVVMGGAGVGVYNATRRSGHDKPRVQEGHPGEAGLQRAPSPPTAEPKPPGKRRSPQRSSRN